MANGTIAFDTLSTSGQITGTAKSVDTDYVVNGSVKSWINQQNDTIQNNTNDSFNVSSAEDTATGHSTFTVTNNFSADTFVSVASAGQLTLTDRFAQNSVQADGKQPSSSTYQAKAFDVSTGSTGHIDAFMVCCLGDLA